MEAGTVVTSRLKSLYNTLTYNLNIEKRFISEFQSIIEKVEDWEHFSIVHESAFELSYIRHWSSNTTFALFTLTVRTDKLVKPVKAYSQH